MRAALIDPRPDEPADARGDVVARFHGLARSEQLTLWSLRAIARGHAERPALRRALEVGLGSSAEEAFTSLSVVLAAGDQWRSQRPSGVRKYSPGPRRAASWRAVAWPAVSGETPVRTAASR